MTVHRLILPHLPPPELTPNGRRRLHHFQEARAVMACRRDFRPLIQSAWHGDALTGDLAATVTLVLPRGRRRVDIDAVATLVKPVLDELQGVVVRDDRQLHPITYDLRKDDTGTYPFGCVVIDLDDGEAA